MTDNQEPKNNIEKSEKDKKSVIRKKFNGIVISDKMEKTIVVKVDRVKMHPKYRKRYTVSKKYKVHDEKNQYKIDDKVSFIECRPLSKDKRWRVL
ncbi:MAG: 30S ribosomal protein S17 [Patescibacteria group bacterium]|nr:30S ribosomal protein S17 [Patescibacteria group bacterium]